MSGAASRSNEWWVSSPYLLTPSSPSSWCGRGGRRLVNVRQAAVDDPDRSVAARTRYGGVLVDGSVDIPGPVSTRLKRRLEYSTHRESAPAPTRRVCPQPAMVVHRIGIFVHTPRRQNRFTWPRQIVVTRLRSSRRGIEARREDLQQHVTAFVAAGRPGQGAREHRSERTQRSVSEGAHWATPPWSFSRNSLNRRR
jgi:hypothetical protein